ncbi:MAG TPA: methyl-accepting chemotaxis protein, partial [Candidatus Dietzia merdigallinarum]|nr:methyl-accepting chemotaxis protein [Candidatus Dietzia merdigallinarum]
RVGETVGTAEGLVLRVDSTVGDAEGLVLRVGSTVGDAESMVVRVGETVGEAEQLVARVAPSLDFVESTIGAVRPVLEELLLEEGVRAEQARVVANRVTELLVVADDVATKLVPVVTRVTDKVDTKEFEAVLEVIDNLPAIIQSVESDVLPIVRSLDSVAPELSEILVVANNCLEALNGIPGFQRLRRRGGSSSEGSNRLTQ